MTVASSGGKIQSILNDAACPCLWIHEQMLGKVTDPRQALKLLLLKREVRPHPFSTRPSSRNAGAGATHTSTARYGGAGCLAPQRETPSDS